MLTAFGQLVRKHRIERSMKLLTMADALDVSAAFLSAVETGQKSIPKGDFVDRVARFLQLEPREWNELQQSALDSKKSMRIELPADKARREILAAFARQLPEFTEADIAYFQAGLVKDE